MKFTTEQLEIITSEEKQSFINRIVGDVKSKYVKAIPDEKNCEMRLTRALNYFESLGINDSGLLRTFLYLEACHPGYADSINIRGALEESNDPEQRYRDILNSALNLAKRT
ncbi:hypothetical protein H4F52_05165 [Pectobacterium brasiliense]|uniref:hypothetical protein n=1 Tax=Pectobacterium brasiliense TaxID=180957 RepID=UPI0019693F2D|nr:hypothetical protein [Pectobacterium brasiliense]MBN3131143.1 hypothetical protein [Pectobacterium brasiliense]